MSLWRLDNPVMPYDWGSHDAIARLQGREPSGQPEAELWMGAHPLAPSRVDVAGVPQPLDQVIAADPDVVLGTACVRAFGPRLPFLLKVLSAARPLSLQVHPDADQAAAGFAAEEAAGIARSAPERTFRDCHAKPEMLLALEPFDVLVGFRPAAQAAAALDYFDIEILGRYAARLRDGRAVGEVFRDLLTLPAEACAALVAAVGARSAASDDPQLRWVATLATSYPSDPTVVGAVLLNYVPLVPGQAIVVDPGCIHAYLQGTGLEILGNSDNVVRCGYTGKHVALAHLGVLLDVRGAEPVLVDAVPEAGGVERWPTGRAEFALRRVRLDGCVRALVAAGPSVVLCLEGSVELSDADGRVRLARGESLFASASPTGLQLGGSGVVVCASPGGP